ncbi:MAG: TolB family protein [Ktedonobacteraceae bacterium]
MQIINIATTRTRTLTTQLIGADPDWSPDGRKIVFVGKTSQDAEASVYVVASSGNGLKRLTRAWLSVSSPHWSRDGHEIAFQAAKAGCTLVCMDIFTMRSDGTQLRDVSGGINLNASSFAWQP